MSQPCAATSAIRSAGTSQAATACRYGGYNTLADLFGKSSLPKDAKQVVWITASVENNCEYCVAAHSTLALRAGLAARGWVDNTEIDAFLRAGYTHRHVLDIILGVGMKTLSNYTNHIAHTPLDPAWQAQEWSHA